jgi:plasmid stability protein
MCYACDMVECMAHIQIRNVPEDVHRTLKARAAQQGKSLSEYLLAEVRELANEMTLDELEERIRALPPVESDVPASEWIREAREERDRQLGGR